MFSKDLYCGHIKNQGLFGKGLGGTFAKSMYSGYGTRLQISGHCPISFQGLMVGHYAITHSSSTTDDCFDNSYEGKQSVA